MCRSDCNRIRVSGCKFQRTVREDIWVRAPWDEVEGLASPADDAMSATDTADIRFLHPRWIRPVSVSDDTPTFATSQNRQFCNARNGCFWALRWHVKRISKVAACWHNPAGSAWPKRVNHISRCAVRTISAMKVLFSDVYRSPSYGNCSASRRFKTAYAAAASSC